MRQQHAFRPQVPENLESRAVPSVAGIAIPAGVFGISVTLPSQVPIDSPQVQAAFAAFDQSYIRAVDTVLLAPGPNGAIVPSANRAAFDAAVEQSLETLAQQLLQSLGGSASAGSTTQIQVVKAIVGPDSNSLESQLAALSTTAIGLTVPLTTHTGDNAPPLLAPNVVTTAEQVRPTLRVPVAEGTFLSNTSTNPTSSSSSASSPASQATAAIRSAFGSFLGDYFKSVQGVLLSPDATGRVNPQANRSAFDARVDQALQSLEALLASTSSRYPATSGLTPRIQAAIGGNAASSLRTQLANLSTPENAQAAVVRDFTLGSTRAIAQVLSLINGDVSKLLGSEGELIRGR